MNSVFVAPDDMTPLRVWISIVSTCALLLCGCDQDPFGLSTRRITGNYSLERFEGGLYYIQRKGHRKDGGGYIEGTVEYIGWTQNEIFVKRRSTSRGDPDGWMVIDLRSDTVQGPFSEELFRGRYPNTNVTKPAEAWKRL